MISSQQASGFLQELESALVSSSDPPGAAMQLIAQHFAHFHWVGIYWLVDNELRLGPYVGPATEHSRIPVGQGVCGTAVAENRNQIVADVRNVANYLACSTHTRAEIVVLIRKNGRILGQIDADSDAIGAFDESDEALLNAVAERLAALRAD